MRSIYTAWMTLMSRLNKIKHLTAEESIGFEVWERETRLVRTILTKIAGAIKPLSWTEKKRMSL